MAESDRQKNRARALTLAWVLAVAVTLGGLGVAVARATDTPDFCRTACHEMEPYVEAWEVGPHSGVNCVDCHVDPGTTSRLAHKVTALGEVRSHFFGDPAFPGATPADVPNERCIRCHSSITVDTPGFDHAEHAKRGDCQACHADAGHQVSVAALRDAGILNESLPATSANAAIATVDAGKANIAGHMVVVCSRCHDLARTGCPSCHQPRHEDAGPAVKSGACDSCHKPGPAFVFAHPESAACASCHATPQNHAYSIACTSCHPQRGASWKFSHPQEIACAACHDAPAGHRSGTCASCHKVNTSWAFRHPRGVTCTACHSRPASHDTGACTSCHNAGASWSFRHTSSSKCSSCHRSPSGHYSGSCASCHSPTRSWSNARFSHPSIRGGEHSYRSFACASCHPRGYTSASCLKCHDSNSGEGGGDDD